MRCRTHQKYFWMGQHGYVMVVKVNEQTKLFGYIQSNEQWVPGEVYDMQLCGMRVVSDCQVSGYETNAMSDSIDFIEKYVCVGNWLQFEILV